MSGWGVAGGAVGLLGDARGRQGDAAGLLRGGRWKGGLQGVAPPLRGEDGWSKATSGRIVKFPGT
jgi:hypothetical protein